MARPRGSKNKPREAPKPVVNPPATEKPPLPTEVVGKAVEEAMGRQIQYGTVPEKPTGMPVIPEDEPSQLPMRKLWELAKKHGAPFRSQFDRQEIEASLLRVGYEATEPEPEDVNDYWKFHSRTVGKGPISAFDPNGDYSAEYFPDGRCTITHHVAPNLLSRVPGMRYHDEKFEIANLEQFTVRLMLLVNEGDAIFDESVETHNRETTEETDRINRESDHGPASVNGADWKIGQMRELCLVYGFVDEHEPGVQQMPAKLAQALGVVVKWEEGPYAGEEKDWQTLSREVLAKAEELDVINLEEHGPKYGRNAQEPVMR